MERGRACCSRSASGPITPATVGADMRPSGRRCGPPGAPPAGAKLQPVPRRGRVGRRSVTPPFLPGRSSGRSVARRSEQDVQVRSAQLTEHSPTYRVGGMQAVNRGGGGAAPGGRGTGDAIRRLHDFPPSVLSASPAPAPDACAALPVVRRLLARTPSSRRARPHCFCPPCPGAPAGRGGTPYRGGIRDSEEVAPPMTAKRKGGGAASMGPTAALGRPPRRWIVGSSPRSAAIHAGDRVRCTSRRPPRRET